MGVIHSVAMVADNQIRLKLRHHPAAAAILGADHSRQTGSLQGQLQQQPLPPAVFDGVIRGLHIRAFRQLAAQEGQRTAAAAQEHLPALIAKFPHQRKAAGGMPQSHVEGGVKNPPGAHGAAGAC